MRKSTSKRFTPPRPTYRQSAFTSFGCIQITVVAGCNLDDAFSVLQTRAAFQTNNNQVSQNRKIYTPQPKQTAPIHIKKKQPKSTLSPRCRAAAVTAPLTSSACADAGLAGRTGRRWRDDRRPDHLLVQQRHIVCWHTASVQIMSV